jgi:hypothetical protein
MRSFSLVISCLLLSAYGYADPILPAFYTVDVGSDLFGNSYQAGSSTVSASIGTLLAFPPAPGIALSQAIAGPNELGVYGGVSLLPTNITAGTNVQSIATLNDVLLLSNSPAAGLLDIVVDIHGSSLILDYGTGYALTDTYLRLYASPSSACVSLISDGGIIPGCGVLEDGLNHFLLPYILSPGDTVSFGEEFVTSDYCDTTAAWGYNSCFGQASFLDTAQIASITVDDANGSPVSGATVSSLAGVDYTLPPQTATPEPSSFILLGTGIIAVMGAMRRKPRDR